MASASGSKFHGQLSGHEGKQIEIERSSDNKKWEGTVEPDGSFEAKNDVDSGGDGHYKLIEKNGGSNDIEDKDFHSGDWTDENHDGVKECEWNSNPPGIPEFPTLALPIAAVIGLVFFFQNKKNQVK
jgi:hypothetical protein